MKEKAVQPIILDNSYRLFIESIKSPKSKVAYADSLKYFMDFTKVTEYHKLLDKDPRLIQADIIDYILHLRNTKNLAPGTIAAYVAAVKHFYDINEIELKWKKINSFKGEHYQVVEDRPYTREEIAQLLSKAEQRNRAIILLMSSSGVRVGAIPDLKIGNLLSIDKYNIYQIEIYKRSRSKYITFCSNEARKEIDLYLQYRQRYGEKLTKDSPLFRKTFDRADQMDVRNPKPLSRNTIIWFINELLNTTGVRVSPVMTEGMTPQRTTVMQCHGFRKYFMTTCINAAGMSPIYTDMLMGHDLGLTGAYTKLTPDELLEGNDHNLGYVSAMEHLIICNENRLKREVEVLRVEKSKIDSLREEIDRVKEYLQRGKDSPSPPAAAAAATYHDDVSRW